MIDTDKHLIEGWSAFLLRYSWHHFLHLTTKFARSKEDIADSFKRLIRNMERSAQRPVTAFVAMEKTTYGHHHAHALIAGTADLNVSRIQAAWKEGFSRVHKVRRMESVVRYATKWAPHNAEDYLLLGNLDHYRFWHTEENRQ